MPLTEKGRKILAEMKRQYGDEKGERVFYASIEKGKIKGVEGKSKKRGIAHAIDKSLRSK